MENLGTAAQELFDEQTVELLQDIDRSEPHIFSRRHEKKMQKLLLSIVMMRLILLLMYHCLNLILIGPLSLIRVILQKKEYIVSKSLKVFSIKRFMVPKPKRLMIAGMRLLI